MRIKRVKIISAARRPVPSRFFELVGEALVKRRRVRMRYLTRGRGEVTEREVSPQRLVHYRSTWYLDAWCHRSEGLRRFALDAVEEAGLLEAKAKDVAMKQIEAEMDGGYGVYAGSETHWVTLEFSAQAAQWVSREQWHPAQAGRWTDGGAFQLRVPYADPTELAMDILRHVGEVRIIADTGGVSAVVKGKMSIEKETPRSDMAPRRLDEA